MHLIKNGEPMVHNHICSADKKGQIMSEKECLNFAIEILIKEYSYTTQNVEYIPKEISTGADFCFYRSGLKINVKVVVSESRDVDITKIDTSWLVDRFVKYGEIPRLVIADFWCFDEETIDGKPAICGSSFCFKYYPISLIPNEVNKALKEKLSLLDLVRKYAEAWKCLDVSIIAPYLDKDFHYGSDWVFDEMPSRYEYVDYLYGKFNAIKKTESKLIIQIVETLTGYAIMLTQGRVQTLMQIQAKDGRIISAQMTDPEKEIIFGVVE